jgi:hypothetical protein
MLKRSGKIIPAPTPTKLGMTFNSWRLLIDYLSIADIACDIS